MGSGRIGTQRTRQSKEAAAPRVTCAGSPPSSSHRAASARHALSLEAGSPGPRCRQRLAPSAASRGASVRGLPPGLGGLLGVWTCLLAHHPKTPACSFTHTVPVCMSVSSHIAWGLTYPGVTSSE